MISSNVSAPTATTPACGSSWTRSWRSSSAAPRWPAAGSPSPAPCSGALIIQTLTTTVYTIGIPPETTLLFKAVVVIVVCLLQSPKSFRARLRRSGRPARPAARPRGSAARRARTVAGRRADALTTVSRHDRHRSPSPRSPRSSPGARGCPCRAAAHARTCVLFVAMFGVGSLQLRGLLLRPGPPQPLHRQRLPARARGRHDVRDPHRRHRPVGRRRWSRCPRVVARRCWQGGWAAGARCWRWCCWWAPALGLRPWAAVIHYFEIQPFIVTLAGMFLARGLCYVISIDSIPITDPFCDQHGPGADPAARRHLRLARRAHRRWSSSPSAVYVLHAHPVRPHRLRRSAATSSRRC